jgi:SAM-dependent methyltransferase
MSLRVTRSRFQQTAARLAAGALLVLAATAGAQTAAPTPADFQPVIGQQGKDVIWVPTTPMILERMLRMAQVTPRDLVVDLGSGDGRIAIAAAKDFGARARGLEYNPDMVELSKREAIKAGVADRVSFEQADIFKADFSSATVVTMYLLPNLNRDLRPILLKMKPGTRVASHQFDMGEWEPDEQCDLAGRQCFFWVVPAQVSGTWKIKAGAAEHEIALKQTFQKVSGFATVANGKSSLREPILRADQLRFSLIDDAGVQHDFAGQVSGTSFKGTVRNGTRTVPFEATRTSD